MLYSGNLNRKHDKVENSIIKGIITANFGIYKLEIYITSLGNILLTLETST